MPILPFDEMAKSSIGKKFMCRGRTLTLKEEKEKREESGESGARSCYRKKFKKAETIPY